MLDSFARLKRRSRPRADRGRGQRRGDQPARGRHRQHGLRPRGATCPVVLIGDIDRGGVFAQIRRHQGGARARGRGDGRRLHRQQVPRRREPVRRRHATDRRAHRLARASASCRSSPTRRACRRRTRSALERRKAARGRRGHIAVPMLRAHRQFRRFRPVAAGAVACGSSWSRRASRCRSATSSSCPAARRRSPISRSFARRAGTSTSSPMSGAAGGCWAFAAAIRCWADASPTRRAWRGRPARSRGSACSTSTTVLTGEKTLRAVEGACLAEWRAVSRLRDACRADDGPGLRAAAAALRRRPARRRDLAETAGSCGAYVHGLFADDRQRAAWLAALGAGSDARLRGDGRARRSTRSPTIWQRHLDLDRAA